MHDRRNALVEVSRTDDRFALEAYEFLCHALAYTHQMLGIAESTSSDKGLEERAICHVSGQQLLEGVRRFALDQFGMMAYTVFRLWGLHSTSDIGEMVFRLIDAGLWRKSDGDRREDFDGLYDFAHEFVSQYRIVLNGP